MLGFFDLEVEASGSAADGRWRLEGLSFEKPDAPEVRVEYVELPGLWEYGKALLEGRRWKESQRLEIGETTVRLPAPADRAEGGQKGAPGWATLFSDVNEVLAITDRWLPPVSVASFRLEQMGGATIVEGNRLRFDSRVLRLSSATSWWGIRFRWSSISIRRHGSFRH